jgi:transmembrane sensor
MTPGLDGGMDGERIARFVAGECTDEEKALVQAWLSGDPARAQLVESFARLWDVTGSSDAAPDVDRAWAEFVERRAARSTRRPGRSAAAMSWAIRAAAAIVLIAGGALVWNRVVEPARTAGSSETVAYTTAATQQRDVRLPDGSSVTLAPESRLQIAAGFGDQVRAVVLQGQGIFQVSHDARRPFRVLTSGTVTEVLGTRFVVRAYADDRETVVALADGSVSIRAQEDGDGTRALILMPGQVARAAPDGSAHLDTAATITPLLAWAEGRLVFEDTPLTQAARDLGRWYDVDFRIADDGLGARHLTATFQREPLDQILDLIALSLNVRYERSGRVIQFTAR